MSPYRTKTVVRVFGSIWQCFILVDLSTQNSIKIKTYPKLDVSKYVVTAFIQQILYILLNFQEPEKEIVNMLVKIGFEKIEVTCKQAEFVYDDEAKWRSK